MRILQISLSADDLEKRLKKGLEKGSINIYLIVYFRIDIAIAIYHIQNAFRIFISKIQSKDKNRSLVNYCICI